MSKNYVFEDESLDFYDELKNIINSQESEKNEDTENNKKCLITGEPLTEHSIKLNCGHEFNYIPLLQDVKNQKQNWFNGKYAVNTGCDKKLNIGQIKCPLCRYVQNGLIPYNPELYEAKIDGVNYPFKYCMFTHKCSYVFKSGKNKNKECGKECNSTYCLKHNKQVEKQKTKKTKKEVSYCTAIIKSGQNKGKQCGCIAKNGEFCGKHKK